MRILVISDIHANLTALDAVLMDAARVDAVWCLGDLVGYGPDPNECIARVKELPQLSCILGNHDAAVLNQIEVDSFNPEARQVICWTQKVLNDEGMAFLRSLPETAQPEAASEREVTLAHGSPRQPVWEYILDIQTATRSFEYFSTSYCFTGHTHLPMLYQLTDGRRMARVKSPEPQSRLELTPRAILNPGSVGQPRDRDARAAYAIYHPETHAWDFHRVAYNIPEVQERMRAAGLPERHILRLSGGW